CERFAWRTDQEEKKAAIAAAADSDAFAVDDPVPHERVDAREDVLQVAAAHVAEVRLREVRAPADAAANVRQEGRDAFGRIERGVADRRGELPRPGAGRPAVDVDDE